MKTEVITIDGPTSSGKSTIGLLFAQKIGFQFIDTGLIYRAISLVILQQNIKYGNEQAICPVVDHLDIEFKTKNGIPSILLGGEDVTDSLHSKKITDAVPIVAAIKCVRDGAKKIQRRLGESKNTVMAGRDIGSEIFPEAKLKFFITASAQARAERRYKQLKKIRPNANLKKILEEIAGRDLKDSIRQISPFRKPADAVIIDTSKLNIKQSVEKLLEYY